MAKINDHPSFYLALLLSLFSTWAQADDDWLIARVNGQWTWQSTGPEGRVRKSFLNQEVLRRDGDDLAVAVSAPSLSEGDTINCSESARRNPQDVCSSAFLECKPDGGAFSSLFGLFIHGAKGAAESRNSYRCSLDANAVLEAAFAVGLIERVERIEPKKPPKSLESANSFGLFREE